jgi:aquaporin Z
MKNILDPIRLPITSNGNGAQKPDAVEEPVPVPFARKLFAELVGTFSLTLVAAGAPVIATAAHAPIPAAAGAAAVGMILMAMIYSIGPISGAHINPAVTFGFALRGAFHWSRVVPYWLAQIIGAVLAATLLLVIFGNIVHLGANAPAPSAGPVAAMFIEAALTLMFVLVILGTSEEAGSAGPNAAISIGATLALCGMFGGAVSGASLNPARSIGPALVSGSLGDLWVYIVGPLLGAAIAVGLDALIHGSRKPTYSQAEGR